MPDPEPVDGSTPTSTAASAPSSAITSTAASAVPTIEDRVARPIRPVYWPAQFLSVVVFAVYGAYALARQATLLTAGYDLGIFDQAVRDYSRFRAPIVPVKGGDYNIFADHFHPIIAVAAPLYWIWDSPSALLLLQAALIAASVPVVHSFTARRMSPAAALVMTAAYAFGWALQAMVDFDFHEVAFGVPILAVAIDALDRTAGRPEPGSARRADRTLLVAAGLLLLVREDMGIVVVLLGLIRLSRPPRWRWPGVALVVAGVAGYVLATSVVIPHFAPTGFAYWTFDALGPDLPHALLSIVEHPIHAVRLLFTPSVKAQTLGYLFVPLLLLPLRSPYLLLALPLLAERFLNSREALWTTHYHYNALPWLVLTLAMVDGAQRLGVWTRPLLRAGLLAVLLVVPIGLAYRPFVTPGVLHLMISGKAWHVDQHVRDARAVLRTIPGDVCVSVDDRLVPQLTTSNRVTEPGLAARRVDLVVLDLSQKDVGYLQPAPGVVLKTFLGRGFTQILTRGDFVVLRSPTYSGASSGCGP